MWWPQCFFPLLSRTNVNCTSGTYGPYDSLSNSPLHNGPRVLSHHEPNYYVTTAPSSPDLPRGDNGRVSRLLALTWSPQYALSYTLSTVQFRTAKWSAWLSISSRHDFKSMMKCLALEDCIRILLYFSIVGRRGNKSSLCSLATSLTTGKDMTTGSVTVSRHFFLRHFTKLYKNKSLVLIFFVRRQKWT